MTAAAVISPASPVSIPELRERRSTVTRAARHGWATHGVDLVLNDAGELVIEIPGQLYAGIAGWRTESTWLAAFPAHPRLLEAVRRYETCTATMLRVMTALAGYADPATGRGIRVAHATMARRLDVSAKVVQRCCWAAEDLGLLERVLDGSDMTLAMRGQIRDHYGHHDRPTVRPDGRHASTGHAVQAAERLCRHRAPVDGRTLAADATPASHECRFCRGPCGRDTASCGELRPAGRRQIPQRPPTRRGLTSPQFKRST